MPKSAHMKYPLLVLFFFLTAMSFSALCQTSGTGTRTDPYILDLSSGSFTKSQSVINATGYVLYKFHLSTQNTVIFSSCGSTIHTVAYAMDITGNVLGLSNGYGPSCASYQASLNLTLAAGDYYYCEAGYHMQQYTGTVLTSITCTPFSNTPIETNTTFAQAMETAFGKLETSRVPYGLLRDAAFEQTDLSTFDGVLIADSNHVSIGTFCSIYQTLISSKISSNAPYMASMSSIDSLALPLRQPGTIILYSLYYNYSKFTADAVTGNRVSIVNNQVVDNYVSGLWQNPYEIKSAFAVSPVTNSVQGLVQQFLMPKSLQLTNNASQISSIQLDAGDGAGYRTITAGVPVTVTFPSPGNKELLFKYNLSTGISLVSHSQLFVDFLPSDVLINATYTPITSTESYNGIPAYGYATIRYSNAQKQMKKPLIVVEGYDAGEIINPELKFGINTAKGFNSQVLSSGSSSLISAYSTYDLVYIDYRNGTDDIKRNALLFKEVIRLVNRLKAQAGSSEPNVVIGSSMGGLVARWGLRDMENHNEDHQTRLYVSYDTPQQGASAPLGYQYMANHLHGLYMHAIFGLAENFGFSRPNLVNALFLGSRPASRQMLINYVNPFGIIDNSIHAAWQSDLKTMGYPQGVAGKPIRNIAISNGTECGSYQVATPGASLLSVSGRASTTFLTDLVGGAFIAIADEAAAIVSGRPGFLLGIIPGSNRIDANVNVNALANGGGNNVYTNHITYTKKILFIIPITVNITNVSNNAPSGLLSYDSYAGGGYYDNTNFTDPYAKQWFYKYNITISHNPVFGFVPEASALDIGGGNTILADVDYRSRYVGSLPPAAPNATPFANFTTGALTLGSNENHININANNGDWLAAELNRAPILQEDFTPICSPVTLSGPSQLCSGASLAFSVNTLPGRSVAWTTSPDLSIVSGQGTPSVTVKPNGTNNTNGTSSSVTETIYTSRGNQTSSQILVRPGFSSLTSSIGNCNGASQDWTLNAVANAPATNWQWTADNPTTCKCYFSQPNSPQTNVSVGGGGGVTVTYTDACGYIHSTGVTVYSSCNTLASIVQPNPSNSSVSVDFNPPKTKQSSLLNTFSQGVVTIPETVEFFSNASLKPLKTLTKSQIISNGNMAVFIVKGLPSGFYFIHANYIGHTEQGTVQVY